MDYFYDDNQQEFFSVKEIVPEMNTVNDYVINRSGMLKKTGKSGDVEKTILYLGGYPAYCISLDSISKDKRITIHRLLSLMFIPNINPDIKNCVDHIDRDRNNYSLSNLRWVSVKENNQNKYKPSYTGYNIYEAYKDNNFTEPVMKFNEEELFNSLFIKERVRESIRQSSKYKGFYWKIRNKLLDDYLRCGEVIDESLWKLHYSGKYYLHPLGLIKSNNLKGQRPTPGYASNFKGPYLTYNNLYVHRLLAEVFLNNNTPIGKDLFVDHLDTNPANNRIENLKICTRIENMNNPITLERNKKKVLAEGVIYDSITECAKHYGVTRQAITFRLNSKYQKDFSYI